MERLATLLLLAALAAPAVAQQNPPLATYSVGNTTLTLSALATGLDTPWELLWGPDNFLWMTERNGRISRINPATGQLTPLLNVPDVTETGESGLLGMVVAPVASAPAGTYDVFVVYNYTDGALKEKLVRYRYASGALTNPQVILGNIPATTTHSGSRLLLLPDNTLLMTTGDAQQRPEAQNRDSQLGKILRLNRDGTVPADNPTPGSLVYTLGHRNPQGLTRSPSGRLYSAEHGQDIDDEVNLIEANRNYGWPNVEGPCNLPAEQTFCTANNVREPLTSYTPTLGVSGLAYYSHPAIPAWNNTLLLLSLRAGRFIPLQLNTAGTQVASQTNLWSGTYGRLRAVCVSPQGRIYIGTSNRDGRGSPAATDDRILVLENRAFVLGTASAGRVAELALWPNPAKQSVTVQLPASAASTTVVLRDALGRVARTATVGRQPEATVDLRGLARGLYMVQASAPDGTQYARRLVVE